MQRQICWIEREEDGTRREIRVSIASGKIKWQSKHEHVEQWDYNPKPSTADWDALLTRVENRHNRRTATHDDMLLVRRLHKLALNPR